MRKLTAHHCLQYLKASLNWDYDDDLDKLHRRVVRSSAGFMVGWYESCSILPPVPSPQDISRFQSNYYATFQRVVYLYTPKKVWFERMKTGAPGVI